MSAAAVFAAELDALGIWWPRGDGDALREAARTWSAVADELEASAFVLETVAACVADAHHGAAAVRFATQWSAWTGPDGHLQATVTDCRRLAAALADFGTDVDVADRAVLLLAEQALAEMARALTPDMVQAWIDWLIEGSDGVRADLATRAVTCTTALAACTERRPATPDASLPVELDPARIAWPDMGVPTDRSAVGTTPVDLGAGPGELPSELLPPVVEPPVVEPVPPVDVRPGPVTPDPITPYPPSSYLPSAGGPTIVIVGNSGTITIDIEAPATAALPLSYEPAPLLDAVPDAVPSFAAFDPAPAWEPPAPVELPAVLLPESAPFERPPEPVPVSVTPPGSGAVATAGVAAAATAATAVVAEAAKKNNGFMPFMPMGGGASSGDEGPEPRRRVRRPNPTPTG